MKILRLNAVLARTGLSRATVYRYMKLNEFPQAIKLGLRSVGWAEHEVEVGCKRGFSYVMGFFTGDKSSEWLSGELPVNQLRLVARLSAFRRLIIFR